MSLQRRQRHDVVFDRIWVYPFALCILIHNTISLINLPYTVISNLYCLISPFSAPDHNTGVSDVNQLLVAVWQRLQADKNRSRKQAGTEDRAAEPRRILLSNRQADLFAF